MNHNVTGSSRRRMLQRMMLSMTGAAASGWLPALAARAGQTPGLRKPPKSCILLWMSGGPSQAETFDPKPGHENGGPTQAIDTAVPGIRISEHLPQVAAQMKHLAAVRSMTTKEGDHTRATYFLKTGYRPQGPVRYPAIGAALGKELHRESCDLPSFVSINPFRGISPAAFGPGFLGPSWSPLVVNSTQTAMNNSDDDDQTATPDVSFAVRNLDPPALTESERLDRRLNMLNRFEHDFLADRPGTPGISHQQAYQKAVRMMQSSAVEAFDLDQESDTLRDAYGRNAFGQGCLLARRLIEHDVSFVEVSLSGLDGNAGIGWDTHTDNFDQVASLCGALDPAWATLMTDLQDRGLLEDTLVVWMGEFGRTPQINDNAGRDHWPGSWSAVLGGAGIRGGQVYGATAADGVEITENPVAVPDLMATICQALGLDHETYNPSNIGRPIPLADHGATPIADLLI